MSVTRNRAAQAAGKPPAQVCTRLAQHPRNAAPDLSLHGGDLLAEPSQSPRNRFSVHHTQKHSYLMLLASGDLTAMTHGLLDSSWAGRVRTPSRDCTWWALTRGRGDGALSPSASVYLQGISRSPAAWQEAGITLKESQSVSRSSAGGLGRTGGRSFVLPEVTQTVGGWSTRSAKWGWGNRSCSAWRGGGFRDTQQ